jgi:hypothetical protein
VAAGVVVVVGMAVVVEYVDSVVVPYLGTS